MLFIMVEKYCILGTTRFEFREGETIVLTGYIDNKNIRNKVICVDY